MRSNIQLLVSVVLVLLSSAPSSHARAPRGRQRTGNIQQVDAPTRHVVLLAADDGKRITFTWINRTMFVANNRVADAAILTRGVQVQITLHRPIFGEPFVTRVILLNLPRADNPGGPKRKDRSPPG